MTRNSTLACALAVATGCGSKSVIIDASTDGPCEHATAAWVRVPENPTLVPGQRKSDGLIDLAVADPDVVWDADAGLFKIWYATTRQLSFLDATSSVLVIEYAESPDGVVWTTQDAPVLRARGAAGDWDFLDVETPSVVINPAAAPARRYVMAYSGYDEELPAMGFGRYRIGIAFSPDGKQFTRVPASESPYGKAGLVLEASRAFPQHAALGAASIVADPELVLHDGVFHLWFSGFACTGACTPAEYLGYGVSHATSTDGVIWTADADNPIPSLRNPEGSAGAQPTVVYDPRSARFEMWLTNDRPGEPAQVPQVFNPAFAFRHAVATDGRAWQIDYAAAPDYPWSPTTASESLGMATGTDVVLREDVAWMFYPAFSTVRIPPDFVVPVHPSHDPDELSPGVMALSVACRRNP